MTAAPDIYQAIAAREKASRKEAERLLEEKSRELYRKNTQLEETNALLTEIMAVAPNGILLCTEDFLVREANAASARLLECSRADLAGRRLNAIFPNVERQLRRLGDGEFFIEQHDALSNNQRAFPVEIRGYAGLVGADSGYLVFFHDISKRLYAEQQRKQIEQQVDEARRLEAIGA
ncbi:MAG: PAS domain-containing protein, partial [Pseudomonadota bacterium]